SWRRSRISRPDNGPPRSRSTKRWKSSNPAWAAPIAEGVRPESNAAAWTGGVRPRRCGAEPANEPSHVSWQSCAQRRSVDVPDWPSSGVGRALLGREARSCVRLEAARELVEHAVGEGEAVGESFGFERAAHEAAIGAQPIRRALLRDELADLDGVEGRVVLEVQRHAARGGFAPESAELS